MFMHGLISRSFETFVKDAYSPGIWREVMVALDAGVEGFESMFHYDDTLMERLVAISAERLGKPREDLLEDFGTYLVAGSKSGRVRRLLRFGGVDYEDFLHSLSDLPGRAALAVPDIGLPELELRDLGGEEYLLFCKAQFAGAVHVVLGLLRAMADDYGALVLLDLDDSAPSGLGVKAVAIQLLQSDFAEGRDFDLREMAMAVGGGKQ